MDPFEQVRPDSGRSYRYSMQKIAGRLFPRATPLNPVPQETRDSTAPATESPEPVSKLATLACAAELLRMNVISPAAAAALAKHAGVSVDDARRSLDRLDTLERNKPTLKQVGRYGTIGALGGAAAGAIGNTIEHGGALRGATPKAKALNLAASAAKGALGGGALPLLRASSDRHAELGTLRKFMKENPSNA